MADNPNEDIANLFDETNIEDNTITYTSSALDIYMKEIKKYPVLSIERQKELGTQMKNGSAEAREELINCNLRFVVYLAKKYYGSTQYISFDDLISEGNAGLIRATKDYDPEQGAFTTYAANWIRQFIQRAVHNKNSIIRKPVHFQEQAYKYEKYVTEHEKNGQPLPDDEQICKELGITPHLLKSIKNPQNSDTISIDQKIGDKEDTELQNFIPSYEVAYDQIIDKSYNDDLFITIKDLLSPIAYYIIYHRILNEENLTLEAVAHHFNITRERIRQIENKSLAKIKPYMMDDGTKIQTAIGEIRRREQENFKRLKIEPLNPIEIIRYLYVKDDLTPLEADILYLKIFDKYHYTAEDYANYLKEPISKIKNSYEQIRLKIAQKCADQEAFKAFVSEKKISYGASIFNIKPMNKEGHLYQENSTYAYLEYYENLSLEEIFTHIKEKGYYLNSWGKKLITRYFASVESSDIPDEEVIADINLAMFDYKHKDTTLPKDKLQEGYLKIVDELTDEEKAYLASYYFDTAPQDDFITKYPDSYLIRNHESLLSKIERSYYSILKYFEMSFTKEMYLSIRDTEYKALGDKRIKILDMYFGVNGPTYSIKEIASKLNVDYEKFLSDLRTIRRYAITLYNGEIKTINIDKNIYGKYLTIDTKILSPIQKDILRMIINENKSYDEISTLTGLTTYRISTIISQTLFKIDTYRFGIIKENPLNEKDVKELLKLKQSMLSPLEIAIIEKRLLEFKDVDEIAKECNVSNSNIIRTISMFNNLYNEHLTSSISIKEDDIKKECKKHTSDSILTDFEKQILSFHYGFKNEFNYRGLTLSAEQIQERLNITKEEYQHYFSRAMSKLKEQKVYLPPSSTILNSRQFVEETLKDKHLPISSQDREMLNHLFALNGFSYLTINELAKKYQFTINYIRKIIYKAFIQIFKYQAKEIEGQLDYLADILPNLKYFSPYDRPKITDYYLNGLTKEQMCQKYHLGDTQYYHQMHKIKITFKEILNHPDNAKLFDFDFYQEAIKNPLLPYNGDLDLMNQIFALYFGMDGQTKLSISEIKEKLKLDMSKTTIHRMLYELMLSVCKLKDGITKERTFTIGQIYSYYITNFSHLIPSQKKYFLKYFERFDMIRSINCQATNVPALITNDLIKTIYPKTFTFKDYTINTIVHLIKKYQDVLKESTIQALMSKYNIKGKEFMTEKEVLELLQLLEKIDKATTQDQDQKLNLTLKKVSPNE